MPIRIFQSIIKFSWRSNQHWRPRFTFFGRFSVLAQLKLSGLPTARQKKKALSSLIISYLRTSCKHAFFKNQYDLAPNSNKCQMSNAEVEVPLRSKKTPGAAICNARAWHWQWVIYSIEVRAIVPNPLQKQPVIFFDNYSCGIEMRILRAEVPAVSYRVCTE